MVSFNYFLLILKTKEIIDPLILNLLNDKQQITCNDFDVSFDNDRSNKT